MKQVRKIYDRAFKEKAVQLSYDRHNISELARELGVTVYSSHDVPLIPVMMCHKIMS